MRFLHAREIAHAEDNAHAKDNMHAKEMMHAKVELVNDACRMHNEKACNLSSHANRPRMLHGVSKTSDNNMMGR